MDLPDLGSSELLLSLDVVASWQLEQIGADDLWWDWPSDTRIQDMDRCHHTGEPLDPDEYEEYETGFLRCQLVRVNQRKAQDGEDHRKIPESCYELEWFDGGCHLLYWERSDL